MDIFYRKSVHQERNTTNRSEKMPGKIDNNASQKAITC